MRKKIEVEELVEEVVEVKKGKIGTLPESNFGRDDLNNLRDKVNEIVEVLNK
uniref:Uncharacterized protein n=1 Tax=viral metagenome TaxID=1070528 RepID=A0A6M3Y6R6_9ZZZZ